MIGQVREPDALQVASALGLAVDGQLPGGEHGAYSVHSEDGSPQVLKVFPMAQEPVVVVGVDIANRVRIRGVSVPDPYMVGRSSGQVYTLQRRCAGAIASAAGHCIEACHADQILRNWEQFDGACPEGGDWPEAVRRALTTGDAGLWAEHAPVRAAAEREAATASGIAARAAAELLDEIVSVGESFDPGALSRSGAVHRDFHHGNFLIDGNRLGAVIDWEAARPGDARYDLVSLSFWSEVQRGRQVSTESADRIASYVDDVVPPEVRRPLAALYGLHQLWYCTIHRPADLPQMVGMVAVHLAPQWRA